MLRALNPGRTNYYQRLDNECKKEHNPPRRFVCIKCWSEPKGDTYTENEMRDCCLSARHQKIEKKETSFGSALIIGIKY
jgi:hypothetical protein